ncbi:MAG TPA: hypothetical protein EYQ75_12030 [Planctomycetaceae bacterium]|jgi:hypothetical protein|nr:hypothetical protein [Planctomycetaceae bacterium]
MTNGAMQIHGQVRARASEMARTGPPRSTSDVVSGALLEARINVDLLTLDEWKAILFGAFQAVSEASSLPPALSENEFVARETLWKTTVNH